MRDLLAVLLIILGWLAVLLILRLVALLITGL